PTAPGLNTATLYTYIHPTHCSPIFLFPTLFLYISHSLGFIIFSPCLSLSLSLSLSLTHTLSNSLSVHLSHSPRFSTRFSPSLSVSLSLPLSLSHCPFNTHACFSTC